ncbi:MAG: ABC transporter ATP-binding protein [Myxococcota bacterium]
MDARRSKMEAPHVETEAPLTETEAPLTETEAPLTETEAPLTETEAPRTTAVGERLRFEGVSAARGGRVLLHGIDFSVEPGEIVGLAGRNGVGKTTLLQLASGALAPAAGRVLLGDTPVQSLSRRAIARRIALVPQDLHVPFPFRAGELVLMGRSPHQSLVGLDGEADVARALEALARLGIEELADRSVETLSGGERQLVLFARALVQDPVVLLLDEPTAFLDLKHRLEVLREVRRFAAAGRGALVVSHDLTLAARVCDRLVLLGEGEVVAVGRPADVLTPEHLQRAFAIDAQIGPGPDGRLVVLPMLPAEDPGGPGGSVGTPRAAAADPSAGATGVGGPSGGRSGSGGRESR